jgi:hypothetical protein
MLELDEGKLSRPVLRRGSGSNPASLSRRVPGNRHSYRNSLEPYTLLTRQQPYQDLGAAYFE